MARATVEGYRSIDIQEWHRQGLLKPGEFPWSWERNGRKVAFIRVEVESHRVVLWYGIRGPRRKYTLFKEPVYLEFSPCNYGGKRPWFLCPRCSRRVVALLCSAKIRVMARAAHCEGSRLRKVWNGISGAIVRD